MVKIILYYGKSHTPLLPDNQIDRVTMVTVVLRGASCRTTTELNQMSVRTIVVRSYSVH